MAESRRGCMPACAAVACTLCFSSAVAKLLIFRQAPCNKLLFLVHKFHFRPSPKNYREHHWYSRKKAKIPRTSFSTRGVRSAPRRVHTPPKGCTHIQKGPPASKRVYVPPKMFTAHPKRVHTYPKGSIPTRMGPHASKRVHVRQKGPQPIPKGSTPHPKRVHTYSNGSTPTQKCFVVLGFGL